MSLSRNLKMSFKHIELQEEFGLRESHRVMPLSTLKTVEMPKIQFVTWMVNINGLCLY